MGKERILNINILIADRTYPMKVKAEEEEEVRTAAKSINQKIKDLQRTYAAKDKQDYLAMSALIFAVETAKKSPNILSDDEKTVIKSLQKLDYILDSALE